MEIIAQYGKEDLAILYLARMKNNYILEFVESLQPPFPREEKWVIIVSTLFGCPVRCPICDAGSNYKGIVSSEEILQQIDHIISKRFPDRKVLMPKLKIQFARMGEPAFNPNVLDVLRKLPQLYEAPGMMPCISTIAPRGREQFFEKLIDLKNLLYSQGKFQLQFSIHSTEERRRDFLIPVEKWNFNQIAEYGERFYCPGDRKITLNFALTEGYPVDPRIIFLHFDPKLFIIKITPLNPTNQVIKNQLRSIFEPEDAKACAQLIDELAKKGFEVVLSPGEPEENKIGSNCGQYVTSFETEGLKKGLYATRRYTLHNSIRPRNKLKREVQDGIL